MEWLPVTRFLQCGVGDYLKSGGPGSRQKSETFLFEFFDRLQRLDAIKRYSYYLDTLGERNMDEVVRIFNLVNSRGTRLSKSDLALSHICARCGPKLDRSCGAAAARSSPPTGSRSTLTSTFV